jgi:hypothetical protein
VEEVYKPKRNPWIIAVTVTLATIMQVLDTSIANVALPLIAGSFGVSQDETSLPGSLPRTSLPTQLFVSRCSRSCSNSDSHKNWNVVTP